MFDKINKEKQKYESKIIIGFVITGIAFIFFMPLEVSLGPGAFFLIIIPFFGGAIYASYQFKQIKNLSNQFKEKYVSEELKKIFPDSQYDCYDGFSEAEVVESRLLYDRDRFKSEDMITGTYDGVKFKCCDVEQKEVRHSGKHTRVVTVFQGRFYEFDFPKSFVYDLLLTQPYNYRPFTSLSKIKTESVHFNSELKVYAGSEHEAFYILTPDFMEKLLYFDQKYYDKISFSFKDNKLYIAIDTRKDYFDIKAFKTVNASIFKEYQEELRDIQSFIKDLNLNIRLFK